MTPSPIKWLNIGQLGDIPIQGSRRIELNDARVAVFRTKDNELFAIEDKCPHAGGPLSEGIVHGNCVTCPLHNWVISLKDGEAQGADDGQVNRYALRQEGDKILMSPTPLEPAARAHD